MDVGDSAVKKGQRRAALGDISNARLGHSRVQRDAKIRKGAIMHVVAAAMPGLAKGWIEALGSKGAKSGAKRATTTQNSTRKTPTIPTQLSRNKAKDFNARMKAAPYPLPGISVVVVDIGNGLGNDLHVVT